MSFTLRGRGNKPPLPDGIGYPIMPAMDTAPRKLVLPAVKLALGVLALAAATGLAFAAWVENGSAILMTMAESGLSWCF